MFKKVVLFLSLVMAVAASWQCNKSSSACTPVAPQAEEAAILQYVSSANMNAVKDGSGLYYEILQEGSGGVPNLNSVILIKYSGTLTNGTQFDSQNDPTKTEWALRTLIPGWQIAIPKIKKGGKIKMVVPSALAYGCTAYGNIPANSILVFDVELVDFY